MLLLLVQAQAPIDRHAWVPLHAFYFVCVFPIPGGFLFPTGRGVIKNPAKEMKGGDCMHLLSAMDQIYS